MSTNVPAKSAQDTLKDIQQLMDQVQADLDAINDILEYERIKDEPIDIFEATAKLLEAHSVVKL